MDISGVDVDFMNDDEILELCNDIVDSNNEEISVLRGVDVDNLSDDKIQEIYDDVISSNPMPVEQIQEISEINNNIVDENPDEIVLINGQKVNIDELSDDEILAFYDDIVDNGNLIADVDTDAYLCYAITVSYSLPPSADYGSTLGIYMICSTSKGSGTNLLRCNSMNYTHAYCRALAIANGGGSCYFRCEGYKVSHRVCSVRYSSKYSFTSDTNTATLYDYSDNRCVK